MDFNGTPIDLIDYVTVIGNGVIPRAHPRSPRGGGGAVCRAARAWRVRFVLSNVLRGYGTEVSAA